MVSVATRPGSETVERRRALMWQPPVFVVGVPRSGTTLLRMMLDSHPRLALPNESHFVVAFSRRAGQAFEREATLEAILAHERFQRWFISPDHVRSFVADVEPETYPELIRAVFAANAEVHGKERWGDKTPGYLGHLPLLLRWFPDAQFIHMIRDGREAAASVAEMPWGPTSAVTAAYRWRWKVRRGRRAGARLPAGRYHELRLERLAGDPEGSLREICAFLGEPFSPAMLDYPETARAKLPPWFEQYHPQIILPPTPGLRDWRAGLSPRQQAEVETVCARLLGQLGYERPPYSPRHAVTARFEYLRSLLRDRRMYVRRFRAWEKRAL